MNQIRDPGRREAPRFFSILDSFPWYFSVNIHGKFSSDRNRCQPKNKKREKNASAEAISVYAGLGNLK